MIGRRERNEMRPHTPLAGDVLVSRSTASLTHDISILPEAPARACTNHDAAIAEGRRLARQRAVDAWLTVDHCHFLPIATYREIRED
jgi:hypothetical protein